MLTSLKPINESLKLFILKDNFEITLVTSAGIIDFVLGKEVYRFPGAIDSSIVSLLNVVFFLITFLTDLFFFN